VIEMVELLVPGSFRACMLSLAWLSGNVCLTGTVSTPLLDVANAVSFRLTICARNLPKAASLSS